MRASRLDYLHAVLVVQVEALVKSQAGRPDRPYSRSAPGYEWGPVRTEGRTRWPTATPQLQWTDEQWNKVRQVVYEEARKARVAGNFLPLYGPLEPDADTSRD